MIVYFRCLCKSQDKLWAKRLRETYRAEIRQTKNSPKHREEAKLYGLKLPFIVEDSDKKIGRPLYG